MKQILEIMQKNMDKTEPCKCGGTFRVKLLTKQGAKTVSIRKRFVCDRCQKTRSI